MVVTMNMTMSLSLWLWQWGRMGTSMIVCYEHKIFTCVSYPVCTEFWSRPYYRWTQTFVSRDCVTLGPKPGIEYSTGRCELWVRPDGIGATAAVSGFTCLRFTGAPTTTPSPWSFSPVEGGVNRACRGRSENDNLASYYQVAASQGMSATLSSWFYLISIWLCHMISYHAILWFSTVYMISGFCFQHKGVTVVACVLAQSDKGFFGKLRFDPMQSRMCWACRMPRHRA